MEKNTNSGDSTNEQGRVSWGESVRAQQLDAACTSLPGIEYVINREAPLPPAAVLEEYDRACAGTADRIVSLLEQRVEAEITQAKRRQSYEFLTRLVALAGGFILCWYERNPTSAIAFIILAALAGTSMAGKTADANQKRLEQLMNAVGFKMR